MSDQDNSGKIRYLVLYDGLCGLCDHTVQLLLKMDSNQILHFAPLQGETAARVLKRHHLQPQTDAPESVLFVDNYQTTVEAVLEKSEAAVSILRKLGGIWAVGAKLLHWVPLSTRDVVYDWVAKNRYRWFGKFDHCKIPTAEQKQRFLT